MRLKHAKQENSQFCLTQKLEDHKHAQAKQGAWCQAKIELTQNQRQDIGNSEAEQVVIGGSVHVGVPYYHQTGTHVPNHSGNENQRIHDGQRNRLRQSPNPSGSYLSVQESLQVKLRCVHKLGPVGSQKRKNRLVFYHLLVERRPPSPRSPCERRGWTGSKKNQHQITRDDHDVGDPNQ